jgi:hypothetical protein
MKDLKREVEMGKNTDVAARGVENKVKRTAG